MQLAAINSIANARGYGRVSLALTTLMMLSGCLGGAGSTTPLEVVTVPTQRPPLVLPEVDPVSVRPINWIVVTPENVDAVFAQLAQDGENLVLFALTDTGYEDLSLNLSDIRQLIQQQRTVMVAYRNYINNSE